GWLRGGDNPMDGLQGAAEVKVSADRRRLKVRWPDGRTVDAPAAWLFDNAEDAFDAGSGHRLRGARDLDAAREVLGAQLDGEAISVRFGPGGETRRVALTAFDPA